MNTDYADAINQLGDEVSRAASRVDLILSPKEIADELRRLANEIEDDS